MPSLDDLRRLSVVLPPDFRLQASEVADLLSASIAVEQHPGLLEAADANGAQGVADFLHQHVSDNRPDGVPEPERGQPSLAGPPAYEVAAGAGQVSQTDFQRLEQLVRQLVHGKSSDDTSAAAATDTPAPAPDAPPAPDAGESTVPPTGPGQGA